MNERGFFASIRSEYPMHLIHRILLPGLSMILASSCIIRPVDDPPLQLLELSQNFATPSESESPNNTNCQPVGEPNHAHDPIIFFSTLDLTGKPQTEDWSKELEIKNIQMEVISEWDDGNRYIAIVRFVNTNKDDVVANLHLYAYDRLGRLVRTEFEGNVYFRRSSVFTKQYTFTKKGREVRWIINLTGK
jgi:hypothetical protein